MRFKYKQKVALSLIMDWDTTEFNNIFKQQGTQPNVTGNTNKQIKFSQTGTTHIQSFVTGLLYKNSLGCLHDVSQFTTTGKSFLYKKGMKTMDMLHDIQSLGNIIFNP